MSKQLDRRGGIGIIIFDEFAFQPGELYDNLLPLTATGPVLFHMISTPNHKQPDNMFHKIFLSNDPQFRRLHIKSGYELENGELVYNPKPFKRKGVIGLISERHTRKRCENILTQLVTKGANVDFVYRQEIECAMTMNIYSSWQRDIPTVKNIEGIGDIAAVKKASIEKYL